MADLKSELFGVITKVTEDFDYYVDLREGREGLFVTFWSTKIRMSPLLVPHAILSPLTLHMTPDLLLYYPKWPKYRNASLLTNFWIT